MAQVQCKSKGCTFNTVGRSAYCSSCLSEFNLRFKRNNSAVKHRIVKENAKSENQDDYMLLDEEVLKREIIKRKAFCNSSITPLRNNKPHICLRGDYWRVSPFLKPFHSALSYHKKWQKAHCFVNTLNAKRFDL